LHPLHASDEIHTSIGPESANCPGPNFVNVCTNA
jgi:hypothetical protein